MSFAYHPQIDGQTEVLNRVIEQTLCAFVHNKPYNTSCHSSSTMSPYEITFGKKPFTLPEYLVGMSTVAAIDDMLSYREVVFAAVQNKLLKAQVKMKQ